MSQEKKIKFEEQNKDLEVKAIKIDSENVNICKLNQENPNNSSQLSPLKKLTARYICKKFDKNQFENKFKKLDLPQNPDTQQNQDQATQPQKVDANTKPSMFDDAKVLEKYSDRTNYGPKYNQNGDVIEYSIVGKTDWFANQQNRASIQDEAQQNTLTKTKSEIDKEEELRVLKMRIKLNKGRARAITTQSNKQPSIDNLPNSSNVNTYNCNNNSNSSRNNNNNNNSLLNNSRLMGTKDSNASNAEVKTKVEVEQQVNELLKRLELNKSLSQQQNKQILEKMNYGERAYVTKDERIIKKFNLQQNKWEKVIKRITDRSCKKYDDSVILQADNFRAKLETVKALDMIESDVTKYGERYWMMGLRLNKNQPKISNRPSQKIIADIPDAFKNYSPGRKEPELEIIRKPVSSKLKSKWEGKLPFRVYNSGKYFEQRLKKESKENLAKIKLLDDREYDRLEVQGKSKLQDEISYLLDKSTNETKFQILKTGQDDEEIEDNQKEQQANKMEDAIVNYDANTIRRKGGICIKTYNLQQQG